MVKVTWVDQFEKIDWAKVALLLRDAQWSRGITQAEVEVSALHSAVVVGAYVDGSLIGYARVVSDRVRFAYLMDVIVEPAFRKRGIGRAMVQYLLDHPDLKLVYQWMLRTRDAQGVYAPLGFRTIVDPSQWMVIQTNRPTRDPFPGL